jgi:biopolymer transport protein ExbB/TolQ
MYVFGIDIPLVEIFFVMAVFVVIMIALLVYLIARVHQINRRILKLSSAEKRDVISLKAIEGDMEKIKEETEQDICLLSNIKDELDKVLRTSWKGVVIEKKSIRKVHKKVEKKIKEKKKKVVGRATKLPPQYNVSYFARYKERRGKK